MLKIKISGECSKYSFFLLFFIFEIVLVFYYCNSNVSFRNCTLVFLPKILFKHFPSLLPLPPPLLPSKYYNTIIFIFCQDSKFLSLKLLSTALFTLLHTTSHKHWNSVICIYPLLSAPIATQSSSAHVRVIVMASEQSSLPPISFPQIPPTHRHYSDFPLTSFSSGPLATQQSPVLQRHLFMNDPSPLWLSGLWGFPLMLHTPGPHPTFLSHYLSPQPLGSNQQYLSVISHTWFAHFHLCIFLHANSPPTDLQIHFCYFHQYRASLQNSVHHSFLQKFLLTQLQPSIGFLLYFIL